MELIDSIRENFLQAKYLKKETIQLNKNESSLDWIVAKGLVYTLSDNNIIYLRQNMYIVVDTDSSNFTLHLIVKNILTYYLIQEYSYDFYLYLIVLQYIYLI